MINYNSKSHLVRKYCVILLLYKSSTDNNLPSPKKKHSSLYWELKIHSSYYWLINLLHIHLNELKKLVILNVFNVSDTYI